MGHMMKELYESAVEGSVPRLLSLLKQDSLILNRCTITIYSETPLHIASMLGHLDFCSELLSRNPEMAEALDSQRSSPLHLASAKGYLEIVKNLVSARPEMCFMYDGDGNYPVHLAAMKGQVDVLEELVKVHPDAAHARVRNSQNWTILHLCIQYYQTEALKFLVDALDDHQLINAKDENGNSILHLSVADKQVEIIEFLVSKARMDVNALNSSGQTTLDILAQTRRDSKYIEIAYFLQQYAARTSSQKEILANNQASLSLNPEGHKGEVINSENIKSELLPSAAVKTSYGQWLEEQRQSLMVVASLLATMGFQAVITPPGGLWSDDSKKEKETTDTNMVPYKAGQSIMAVKDIDVYTRLMFFNTLGFMASLGTILLLISGLRFKHKAFLWILMVIVRISIFATAGTYILSLRAVAIDSVIIDFGEPFAIISDGVVVMFCLLIMATTIHSIRQRIKKWAMKEKVYFWMLMLILWIIAAVLYLKLTRFYELGILVGGCVLFAVFLVLLYAMQMKNLIINKVRSCFQQLKSCLSSSNPNMTQV